MNLKNLKDKELVKLLAGNEEVANKAYLEIYERYSKKVYIYCKKAINNENFFEDIFQDIFINFYNAGRNGYVTDCLQPYLFKIARNLCLNYKRDNKQILIHLEEIHIPEMMNDTQSKELAELINSALDLLNDEYKEAFILQAYQSLSYNEISEILEVLVSTFRNRIVRAKRKLSELLSPYLESSRV
jgi:RNA polymerase sigma-70 factor (ECF subfamily)